jgi:cytochrome P450
MDESEYDNPAEFRPERWLGNKFGTKSRESEAVSDSRRVTYAFGAGRRICSGQGLAENSLVSRSLFRIVGFCGGVGKGERGWGADG